jgi:hypothetical protein
LKLRSFLSQSAFIKKPLIKNVIQTKNSGPKVPVSLKKRAISMGKTVSDPAIWNKNPIFARMALDIRLLRMGNVLI